MSGGNKTQEIDYNSVGKTPKAMRTDNKAQKDVVKAPNALIYGAAYIVCWLISKILFRASYRRTRNFRRHKEAMIKSATMAVIWMLPWQLSVQVGSGCTL